MTCTPAADAPIQPEGAGLLLAGNFVQNDQLSGLAWFDANTVIAYGAFNSASLIDVTNTADPQPISGAPYVMGGTTPTSMIFDSPFLHVLSLNFGGLRIVQYVGP